MATAVYPGTFDPVTRGHMDLIDRGMQIFDQLIVAVARNTSKVPLFDTEERVAMLLNLLRDRPNVSVEYFEGLIVEFCRQRGAKCILRGIRTVMDFEYEFQMALTNRSLARDVETVFVMPSEEYSYISSSLVKEIAAMGGNVAAFVCPEVSERMRQKLCPDGKPSPYPSSAEKD